MLRLVRITCRDTAPVVRFLYTSTRASGARIWSALIQRRFIGWHNACVIGKTAAGSCSWQSRSRARQQS